MRRSTIGLFFAGVLTLGLAPTTALASSDGTCPANGGYRLESVFAVDDPTARQAIDARTGSIDNLVCVLELNPHAGFRNVIDNMVQGP
jgi:hypothetical protein